MQQCVRTSQQAPMIHQVTPTQIGPFKGTLGSRGADRLEAAIKQPMMIGRSMMMRHYGREPGYSADGRRTNTNAAHSPRMSKRKRKADGNCFEAESMRGPRPPPALQGRARGVDFGQRPIGRRSMADASAGVPVASASGAHGGSASSEAADTGAARAIVARSLRWYDT